MSDKIFNSRRIQGRTKGWDTMKPLYWKSVNRKGAGRPRLTHNHRGGWNEMNEMSVEKWWTEICVRENSERNLSSLRFVHHETQMQWPRREHGYKCAPVTQRARVRSPIGTCFLGEVFRGLSSPVRQMSGIFRPSRSPNIIWPSLSFTIIHH